MRAYTRPAALGETRFTREMVDRAVAAAFGATADDVLLRRDVELADLDPATTHNEAVERLAVSRATYFRHLRQARDRVAAAQVDAERQRAGPGAPVEVW